MVSQVLFLLRMMKIKVKILFCFFTLASSLNKTCIQIKVLALNTWGMPAAFGSEDKEDRMKDIGEFVQKGEFDIYLFSELWMRPDHATIKSYLPKRFVMTDVGELAKPDICEGRGTPSQCSGLAIVSRVPFEQISFTAYTANAGVEVLVAKGIGKVRIILHGPQNITMDVIVTHTCADENNAQCREAQVTELMTKINESDADFVVLGGDLNVDPRMKENSYKIVTNTMVNSMEDAGFDITDPRMATYGNPENTYSNKESPVVFDYIFHKANANNWIDTTFFQVPLLKSTNTNKSFSDHEAVETHLSLCKPEKTEGEENKELEEDFLDEDSSPFDKEMPEHTWTKSKKDESRFDDQTRRHLRDREIQRQMRDRKIQGQMRDWDIQRQIRDRKIQKQMRDRKIQQQMRNRKIQQQMRDKKIQQQMRDRKIQQQMRDRKIQQPMRDRKNQQQMRDWKLRPYHSRDHIKCKRLPCVRSKYDFWKRNRDAMAIIRRKEHGGEEENK